MSMATLHLPLLCRFTGKRGFKTVSARVIDVAPHLAHIASFAIHRISGGFYTTWRISNIETGASLASCDHDSAAACEVLAREFLAKRAAPEMSKALASWAPKHKAA